MPMVQLRVFNQSVELVRPSDLTSRQTTDSLEDNMNPFSNSHGYRAGRRQTRSRQSFVV